MQLVSKDASDKTLQKQAPICSWKNCVLLTGTGKFQNASAAFWRVGCTEHIYPQVVSDDVTVSPEFQRTSVIEKHP